MSKKRRKYRFSHHPAEEKADKRNMAKARYRLENDILACLFMSKKPVTIEKISSFLSGKDKISGDIHATTNFLLSQNLIRKTGKKQFTLNKAAPLYKGLLELNPKGFGFVTMEAGDEAKKAIDELNGATLESREMVVNEAKPRKQY